MHLKMILAQLDFTVGDIQKNAEIILSACRAAKKNHAADLVVFPELALSGYPPEDLLLRDDFLIQISLALEKIQGDLPENLCAVIGYPEQDSENKKLRYNSAAVLIKNKRIAHYRKQLLPNFGVFDELRYFTPGRFPCVFSYKNHQIGLIICQDLWEENPAAQTQKSGANILIALNASPFHAGKLEQRLAVVKKRVHEINLPIVYVNHCGAQDDLIFDGSSFILNQRGNLIAQAPFAKECLWPVNLSAIENNPEFNYKKNKDYSEQIYQAIMLSLKDYVRKNNFEKVLLGFSGGIDSALTLSIAADALGKENVLPMLLPSRYTSPLSTDCAKKQFIHMGISQYREISIEPAFQAFLSSLGLTNIHDLKALESPENLTRQNLQARIRAVILMAVSNQTNALLLNTSNKSEIAAGYGTLYGDMCGAYGVIKDLWKTQVYALADYRNKISTVIPEEIINRRPSAELSPNQADTDTLPPYSILDKILKKYIEQEKSVLEIAKELKKLNVQKTLVKKIVSLIQGSEYKRKQTPPGPRISALAFTRERRYPITSAFDAK